MGLQVIEDTLRVERELGGCACQWIAEERGVLFIQCARCRALQGIAARLRSVTETRGEGEEKNG